MHHIIKNIAGIALIIWLLTGSYVITQYVKAFARSTEPSSFRSFAVSGEGKARALPDIAQVIVGVITEGESDIAKIQDDNTKKVNDIIALAKSNLVEEKDISTKTYSIDPRYQYVNCKEGGVCPPPKIVGYTVRQEVEIKMRDFKKIGAILNGAVGNGANSVSQLQFTIDNQQATEKSARAKAFESAKKKADDIAEAGGFRLGRLLSVSEGGGYQPEPIYRFGYAGAEDAASLKAAPTIEPGSQEISVSVTLTYEIE